MGPFASAVSGAVGGFAAGFVAQALVTLAGKLGLGWSAFQAPGVLPFFPTALFMGVFYAVIAWAISRKRAETAIGFAGPFFGMALPLGGLGRFVAFGLRGTVAVYGAAVWGTVAALGWRLGGRWLGLAAAVGASLAAYGAQSLFQAVVPSFGQGPWRPTGFLPQATVLLDGLLTGAFLGLSVAVARRHYEKASRA